MKTTVLLLAATISLSAFADEERESRRDQPEKRESKSLRLPPKEGESPEARKLRLLDQLKKRRATAETAREREGDREPGPAARPERGHGRDVDKGRDHARDGDRRHEGDHDRKLRAHLAELEKKIAIAKRAGRHEEAENLTKHIRQLREHGGREEHARNEREMHERRERAAHGRESDEHSKRALSAEDAERRMIHLREAAELLGAVGKRDEAERLEREAAGIEQQLRRHHGGRGGQPGPSNAELGEAVRTLQKQIEELHRAIQEIHRHLNRKP